MLRNLPLSVFSSQKQFPAVCVEIRLGWPISLFPWPKDVPTLQGHDMAGEVLFQADSLGNEYLVLVSNAQKSHIEKPMADPAKGHSIGWTIIMTFVPRNDMSRLNDGKTVGREDADPTRSAPVLVKCNDDSPKPLIPHILPKSILPFPNPANFWPQFQQSFAVSVSFVIYPALP